MPSGLGPSLVLSPTGISRPNTAIGRSCWLHWLRWSLSSSSPSSHQVSQSSWLGSSSVGSRGACSQRWRLPMHRRCVPWLSVATSPSTSTSAGLSASSSPLVSNLAFQITTLNGHIGSHSLSSGHGLFPFLQFCTSPQNRHGIWSAAGNWPRPRKA